MMQAFIYDCTPRFVHFYKFTGKERDAESGLDNFGARMYGSSMGRFMSPDTFWGGILKIHKL
jgi:RHS repeat-associated protein